MSSSAPRNFEKTLCCPAFLPNGEVNEEALSRAESWLNRGWPVVVPSETVYGLAAPATNRRAVARVFAAKGRPSDNPLIVHVTGLEQAAELHATPSKLAEQLARQFWPGPLTLVVECETQLPWITAGLNSIALRQPQHAFFRALIARVGPLAAPSANRSGLPSPTLASHCREDLAGQIPLIIDGGAVLHGLESTVVDTRREQPVVLRHGAVVEELLAPYNSHRADPPQSPPYKPRSPGLKYRHYSPQATIWLYPLRDSEPQPARLERMREEAGWLRAQGQKVATICSAPLFDSTLQTDPEDPAHFAHHLFGWLRQLDHEHVDHILIEGVQPLGLGRALLDRMTRAARYVRSPGDALPANYDKELLTNEPEVGPDDDKYRI